MMIQPLRKMARRKTALWKMMVILLGVLLLAGCSQASNAAETGQEADVTPIPTPVVPVKPTYTVQRGSVVNALEFTGRISPIKEVALSFHTNGYIREIFVQRGDAVQAGQVLADLEVSDLETQLEQARLALKTSETQLIAAQQVISDALTEAGLLLAIEKIKLEQANYLFENERGKQQDFRMQEFNIRIQQQATALAQLRVDRLERGVDPQLLLAVEAAQLTVQRLDAQFVNAQIIAPMDGVVTSINIFNPGQSVSAYNPVVAVGDISQLEVSADLFGNSGVAMLSQGMAVVIEPHDRPGSVQLQGTIRYVPTGEANELDKTTRIALEAATAASLSEAGLGLGDLVRVRVVIESKDNVLWLPPQAIRVFEGRQFVVVQDVQGLRRVDVTLGIQGSERVEIMSGLSEGQIVQSP